MKIVSGTNFLLFLSRLREHHSKKDPFQDGGSVHVDPSRVTYTFERHTFVYDGSGTSRYKRFRYLSTQAIESLKLKSLHQLRKINIHF